MSSLDELIQSAFDQGESRLPLSALGARLSQRHPGFRPSDYGFAKLKSLLRSCPESGQVVQGDSPLEWWFILSTPRLEKSWWEAITRYEAGVRGWFDLATEALVEEGLLVGEEPERYIEIPRFDLERQTDLAADWLGEQHPVDSRLREVLEEEGLPSLLRRLTPAEMSQWEECKQKAVVEELSTWCRLHGVDMETLTAPSPSLNAVASDRRSAKPTVQHSHRAQGTAAALFGEEEFRSWLHDVIDQMTREELAALSIPARFLIT